MSEKGFQLASLEQALQAFRGYEGEGPREKRFLKAMQAAGIYLDTEQIPELLGLLHLNLGRWYCPRALIEFIGDCLGMVSPDSILDIWAGYGGAIIPLVKRLKPSRATAISAHPEMLELARMVSGGDRIQWKAGTALTVLEEDEVNYDAIVGCLPITLGKQPLSIASGGSRIELRDHQNHLMIASALQHLSRDGVGLFVVGPRLGFPRKPRTLFSELGELGFHVEAYVSTPPGTWTNTSMPFGVAMIRRGNSGDTLFVGELSDITQRNRVLLENLMRHEDGSDVGLGRLVRYSTFQGYQHLVGQDRVAELENRLGIPGIPLTKIATAINLTKAKEAPGFEEEENAIYVPLIGKSDVRTLLSDLSLKPHNYAQVVLDQTQADARYVAGFLNSPDGLIVRESAFSGVHIPKMSKTSLRCMPLFLPDTSTSGTVLEVDMQLRELQSELAELRKTLWSRPSDIESTLQRLSRVNRGNSLIDWLETLPFPLATILWAYWTNRQDDLRAYKRLLHFFEAFAELLADIVLSAFRNDPELFSSEWKRLRGSLAEAGSSLDLGTFGLWVRVFERLAKVARGLLSGKPQEASSRSSQLFHSRDVEAVSRLLSTGIVGVLQKANAIRNKDAHGGALGQAETRRRHDALRDLLESVRSESAGAWSRLLMVLPGSMEFEDGVFVTSSRAIVGSRTPFDSISVRTSHPLTKNRLHLMVRGETTALELVPLLRIMPSSQSEENACYFYNRREAGKVRFISYHFDADADMLIDAPDTIAFLDELMER